MLREREAALRDLVPPDEDFAGELARPVGLRAPLARLEPDVDDLAREADDFAPPLFAREDVERDPEDFAREPDEREDPLDLRAPPLLRDEPDEEPELVPALALPSIVHLPDITRCAASATASAISEPSLVALATTLLAA